MDSTLTGIVLEAESSLPTEFGHFTVKIYQVANGENAIAIISGQMTDQEDVPLRVHSACYTAEVLGSLKCDCKQQLDWALQYIAEHNGVVLYLPQEGRGIGLGNKIRAYALQELGHDTITANTLLGLPVDARSYEDAAAIINDLGIRSIRLLTNNPQKITDLQALNIAVNGRIPVVVEANKYSAGYLQTKREQMGHWLDFKKQSTTALHTVNSPSHNKTNKPFVHINFAINEQGQTTVQDTDQTSISCTKDWQRVHELRERYTAIAVGANTWINDQPRLTARANQLGREPNRQPDRVIFAGHTHCQCSPDQRRTFIIGVHTNHELNSTYIAAKDHDLNTPLKSLHQQQVDSLLVEGGLTLIRSFLHQNSADLLTLYVATEHHQTALNAVQKALPNFPTGCFDAQHFGSGMLLSAHLNAQSKPLSEYINHA